MTFRARIMMLGWTGAVAAMLVGLVAMYVQFQLQGAIERNSVLGLALNHHEEADMMHDAIHADILMTEFAISQNKASDLPEIKKNLDEHIEVFKSRLASNMALPLADKEHMAIMHIKPDLDNYAAAAISLIDKFSSNPDAAKQDLPAFDKAFEALEISQRDVTVLLGDSIKTSTAELATVTLRSKILVMVILLLSLVAVMVFARRIATEMATLLGGEPEETIELVNSMARGSINSEVDTSRADPHSVLAAIGGLRKNLIKILQEATNDLSSVVPELTEAATHTQQDMQKQSAETQNIVSATTQLATASQEVAKNATVVSGSTQDARAQAAQGKKAVDDAIRANRELSTHMNSAVGVVGKLNTGSQQITTFVEVIRTIAEQTNLLALNAAIEAARAGDQGRGFAVVADEVRTLAQRTQGATQEIEQIISSLSEAALEATDSIRKGESLAGSSVERTTELGNLLETINKAIAIVDEGNTQIATAAEEQSVVTRNINHNIERIAEIACTAAGAAERTMQAVRSVHGVAGKLSQMSQGKST